jgi:hypothetical protein
MADEPLALEVRENRERGFDGPVGGKFDEHRERVSEAP